MVARLGFASGSRLATCEGGTLHGFASSQENKKKPCAMAPTGRQSGHSAVPVDCSNFCDTLSFVRLGQGG
jgi:hypothetical protein